jgi:hypothetical protein
MHHHALASHPGMMYSQVAHMQHHMVESPALSAEAEEKRVKMTATVRAHERVDDERRKGWQLSAQVNKLQN